MLLILRITLADMSTIQVKAFITQKDGDFITCQDRFSVDIAKKFLSKKLGNKLLSCKETSFGAAALEEDFGLAKPQGIILESEDKTFRCRLTLSEVVQKLMDSNRAELSDALFGGNI